MTIRNLLEVGLDRTAITSRGLTKLLRHPNLKLVSLSGTTLNFKEALALKEQHANITIRLDPKHWGAYQHILHGAKLTISISGRARKEI